MNIKTSKRSFLFSFLFLIFVSQNADAANQCQSLFDEVTPQNKVTAPAAVNKTNKPKPLPDVPVLIPGVYTVEGKYGPVQHYYNKSSNNKNKNEFRISSYNIADGQVINRADLLATKRKNQSANAQIIKDIDADFQIVVEVENLKTLNEFNKNHLDSKYVPFVINGNDISGKNVGLLVKRDLNLAIEYRSYREYSDQVFSRYAPVALIYEIDSHGKRSTKPKLALMLEHLKSKRSRPGQMEQTEIARIAQAEASVEIISALMNEYGTDLSVVVGGDFNSAISSAKTFYNFGFKDSFDGFSKLRTPENRATHYYFNPEIKKMEQNHIDGLLTYGSKLKVKDAGVHRPLPAPRSFSERQQRPSDHLPIYTDIQLSH